MHGTYHSSLRPETCSFFPVNLSLCLSILLLFCLLLIIPPHYSFSCLSLFLSILPYVNFTFFILSSINNSFYLSFLMCILPSIIKYCSILSSVCLFNCLISCCLFLLLSIIIIIFTEFSF